MEDSFSTDGVGSGDDFRMIQAHCIYCALYFCYCYISSTSDHQALDPRGWGTLDQIIVLTSEFSLQKRYVVGRSSVTSRPDVTFCESRCQSLFSHWVSVCLVCNIARILLILYLQGPLWILLFPGILDILNGRSCVSSWKDPWASIPPLQPSHPLRGLAWKNSDGWSGSSGERDVSQPSSLICRMDSPTSKCLSRILFCIPEMCLLGGRKGLFFCLEDGS